MSWRSVRVRLTVLVVAVAAAAMALASTLGLARVRESLVDDVLDDTADGLFLDEFLLSDDESASPVIIESGTGAVVEVPDEPTFEALPIELDFIVEDMENLVRELDSRGTVDLLLEEMGRTREEGLPILHSFGMVLIMGVDGPNEVLDIGPAEFGGPLAYEFNLQEYAFSSVDVDMVDLFELAEQSGEFDDELFEQVFEDRLAEKALGQRPAAEIVLTQGVEFLVVTDVADVYRSVDKVRSVLLLTMPLLVLAAAGATWILTGRALSPVRRITRQVGVISGGTLHERVPVPPTGDEIEVLGSTMNHMLDRLEADDHRLRQFVSDASHELRSPVAVLRSEAEVALRSPTQTDTVELAEGVLGESKRLERIVADLLVLARADEAGAQAALGVVDLDDVVLAEAARRRRVGIDTSAVSAGRVRGTRDGCTRVLVHLLDNAARHAAATVAVGLQTHRASVILTVDDDGPGIPEADRARVFERFTRLEEARARDTGGSGLGLAVVASTVAAMCGSVEISESPLGGARFRIVWSAVEP